MKKFYPVSMPTLHGNEHVYVQDCLDTGWISSKGGYIDRFEDEFAKYCGVKHAISCCNGTVALHLALLAKGVTSGDEIIIPTFTFVATANAVAHCGATPVLVDAEPDTWNINAEKIKRNISARTKGIIAVHLYGHPADMDAIHAVAKEHGLFVIEDAAEAIGAQYKGRMTGSLADCATFSLFGNKIITTGEGGMITTDDDQLAHAIRILKSQGIDPQRRYWFPVIGYNYRMTNIQAAIGCAQLEKLDWHIEQRLRIAEQYTGCLENDENFILPVQKNWAKNVYWLFSVICKNMRRQKRDTLMQRLYEEGIETRPFFYPMHVLPPYANLQNHEEFPVANVIGAQGINLPTYGDLLESDIQHICAKLKEITEELNVQ